MNPVLGWLLALAALVVGWQAYAWQGGVLAVTLIVFWLVLQFNRALRVMKNAAHAPVGHVDSAVMLNAKLQRGMRLVQVVALTRSLGRRVTDVPETWAWGDAGGASVTLILEGGKLVRWGLERSDSGSTAPA